MEKITAFILAGGKSRRMGMDKGFCRIDNQAFIPLIAKCLSAFSNDVILVSDIETYDVFGLQRISDIYSEKGPIAGIHTALTYSVTERNIIVSCDVPFITENLIQKLLSEDDGHQVVQLSTKKEGMPLIALYKKNTIDHFEHKLETNALKLKEALVGLQVKSVMIENDEEKLVSNINTPEQLKQINDEG